jgi:hypothetical protein
LNEIDYSPNRFNIFVAKSNKLSMKRVLFLLFLGSFSSLVAAASNEVKDLSSPDPVKGQQTSTSSSFELSKGYFSLFDLLKMPSMTTPTNDTLRTVNSKLNSGAGLNVQTKFKVQTK